MGAANLHVTLAFLGGVDGARRRCLEDCAQALRAAPFTLVLDRSGWFRRAEVVWLGSGEAPAALSELAGALANCQRHCGLDPDDRPFQAHLTIARRARRPPPSGALSPLSWSVDAFCLVVSDTRPEGAAYQVLRRWRLRTD